jgi:hypothetical protein
LWLPEHASIFNAFYRDFNARSHGSQSTISKSTRGLTSAAAVMSRFLDFRHTNPELLPQFSRNGRSELLQKDLLP